MSSHFMSPTSTTRGVAPGIRQVDARRHGLPDEARRQGEKLMRRRSLLHHGEGAHLGSACEPVRGIGRRTCHDY